jgi:hypothetical protein
MIACESYPLSSTFRSGTKKEYTRSLIFRNEEETRIREKRTNVKRREGGEKKDESKGEERSSSMYRMRVEFYACLIWKWIAREYASMKQVEEAEKGNRRGRKRGERREKRTGEIDCFIVSLSSPLHLHFSLFFLPFVFSLLPSRATRTGQQTARKRENNFLRSRFITQITHLYRTLKTRYV